MDDDYRGNHTAPGPDSAPLYDLTGNGVYPDDVYGPNGVIYYGHYGQGHALDRETMALIKRVHNKPNEKVLIYRAVPSAVATKITINSGDWVTINKRYAIQHGESTLNGEYKILQKVVLAKTLFTNGDSFHEYGYHP